MNSQRDTYKQRYWSFNIKMAERSLKVKLGVALIKKIGVTRSTICLEIIILALKQHRVALLIVLLMWEMD